jgi:hypothetical protein
MKKITVLSFVLILFCGLAVSAQETKQESELQTEQEAASVFEAWPSAVGFYANLLGGGLSWQHWYGATGLVVGTGLGYQPEAEYGYYLDYHVQLQLLRNIHAFQNSRSLAGMLYTAVLLGHRGIIPWTTKELVDPEEELTEYVVRRGAYKPLLYAGAGLGLEYVLFNHLSHTFDFMYVAELTDMTVQISVGTGLHFRY